MPAGGNGRKNGNNIKSSALINKNPEFGGTEGNDSTAHGTIGHKRDGIDSSQML